MLEIFFSIKTQILPGQQVRIVGSLETLGNWQPQKGMALYYKKGMFQGGPLQVKLEQYFEFKIVKTKGVNHNQWQCLPNNSNRKFKPKRSTKIYLQWSKPQGRMSKFGCGRNVVLHSLAKQYLLPKDRSSLKLQKYDYFDPYMDAYEAISSSGQDQDDFVIHKKKMSDVLSTSKEDFQQLFYRTQKFQIFESLMKKTKVYIVCKSINLEDSFQKLVLQKIKQLSRHYLTKWITVDCFDIEKKSNLKFSLRSIGTMFDIEQQQIQNDSLYSKTSYYLFIDLESAKILSSQLSHIAACLFLPGQRLQEVKQQIHALQKFHYIGFSNKQSNVKLLQFLQTIRDDRYESNYAKLLNVQVPSFEQMIEMLKSYRNRDNIIVNKMGLIQQCQALKSFIKPNSFTILEGGMVDRYYEFIEKLVNNQSQRSLMVLLIKQNHLHQLISNLKQYKNIVIIYNNYKNIIIENKEYLPFRKLEERIDEFRMKAKLLQANNGGQIIQKENSFSYILKESKIDLAPKIMADFKNTAKGCSFIKVTRRGKKIKVVWNMAQQARIARTICQLKFTSFGPLGGFDIISDTLSLRQFKDTFELIIKNYPRLFEKPKDTRVKYYSYGGNVPATFHILPDQTIEKQ